jgi:hypothetical protein
MLISPRRDTVLSEVAQKRLKVLGDLDSLGAGFQLASHDLDIRGAGNLLGDEQSGHIREVGFELYQSMLEDAILAPPRRRHRGWRRTTAASAPQITVDAPIMIPEDYVPDLAVRMALYRRLNDAEDQAEIESLSAEMIDRFGPLPEPPPTWSPDRDQAAGDRGAHRQDRRRRQGRAGQLPQRQLPRSRRPDRLCRQARGHDQAAARHEAAVNRVWGDPKVAAQRPVPADQGPAGSTSLTLEGSAMSVKVTSIG